MFTNRLFNLLVAVALAAVIALTVREATATKVLIQADRSYDAVEQIRAQHSENFVQADRRYDQIEQLRTQPDYSAPIADRSYDLIENLRLQRTFK